MSLYLGSQLLAGVATNTIYNAHDLFDYKWTDHLLNDQNWLRADTFSWQDGTVYTEAYSHLVTDYNGGTSQTETIGSYTITYVLAADGHKITTDETNVVNIYNESGVAWYYILDTTNQRFKLPRELPITDKSKGNGIALGFTDGNGNNASLYNGLNSGGSYYGFSGLAKYGSKLPKYADAQTSLATDSAVGITTDQTKSGIISHRANTNGQQYLYFYVGQFSQSAAEQTAGLNSELFNGKVDLNLNNMNPSATAKETIVGWGMPDYESSVSVTSGFVCPSDGIVRAYAYDNGVINYNLINENNVTVGQAAASANSSQNNCCYVFVSKGYTLSQTRKSGNSSVTFYPLKGVQNA